ncbi:uncharacterized protein A1O9_13064 [Exophiala aquamarina CBS 119918]|uniref:Glycosyltransferase family 25 protein n=1 Tax=Exophiala aquamarina CBS 119918 TaxID=1182545 RepID=A0A072NV23_9EURO|nr:uncharacterized protein A1O9_13064 [Exophiala aquamarina CBS 119918]KEF50883.1 hypothetical protein A1O9_13064 [Exophiala aquamarina CBS 119918]
MQAALSSFSYTEIDGVDGHTVPVKALPHTPAVVGCWRAHMNVLQKIVHENIATALVFEDDADWDVSLKQQLVQFARGSRVMINTTTTHPTCSPYGDNWDMLWIGNCGTGSRDEDHRRVFVIPRDPTAEPLQYRDDMYETPNMSRWEGGLQGDHQTRIVFPSSKGVCTAAYGISQQGARKALHYMGMVPYNHPVDLGFADLCAHDRYAYMCVSVFPPLIGFSRPAGHQSKNSDIEYGDELSGPVEDARSQHVVFSVRLNMERLLRGETVFESQFPDVTGQQMHIQDIGSAVGHVEIMPE